MRAPSLEKAVQNGTALFVAASLALAASGCGKTSPAVARKIKAVEKD